MNAVDYIAIAVVLLTLSASVFYIVRAKRRGEKCVGCPYARECGGKCDGAYGHAKADENNDKQ